MVFREGVSPPHGEGSSAPHQKKNEYLLLKLVGSRSLHGKGHFGGCLAH